MKTVPSMTHRQVLERLPWYVNATLPGDERVAVQEHLTTCAECAREREQWQAVAAAARDADSVPGLPPAIALARVRARIVAGPGASGLDRAREAWARVWGPLPAPVRLAFAAPYLVLLALLVLALVRPAEQARFQTASDPRTGPRRGSGVRLVLGFADGVTEAELRRTITAFRGTIVSGPSAQGLYVIEAPLSHDKPAEVEALLASLRRQERIVRSADLEY